MKKKLLPRFSLILLFLLLWAGGYWTHDCLKAGGKGAPPPKSGIDAASKLKVQESYGRLPLYFEANQGQFDPGVKFKAKAPGFSVSFTSDGPLMAWLEKDEEGEAPAATDLLTRRESTYPQPNTVVAPFGRTKVLRLIMIGANPSPEIEGLFDLPGKANYFIGNDPAKWSANVPTYGRVRYKEVYPGVDVVFYGNPRQMEYDFVVAPGADPEAIKLRFEGADRVTLDDRGELIIEAGRSRMVQRAPEVYQEIDGRRRPLTARNVLHEDYTAGFMTAAYDQDRPLIIDPVLTMAWSTYLGGTSSDLGAGIALDASGAAYIAGYTLSVDFPVANAMQGASAGFLDIFVAKINAAGTALVYSTYLGGSNFDFGQALAVDGAGNAYFTGLTYSIDFPLVNPIRNFNAGNGDVFVAKINAAGSALVYSTYLGGTDEERSYGIAVDGAGNAYVTGYTKSNDFPLVNAIQNVYRGNKDVFVTKINAAGTAWVYSTYLGGAGEDVGQAIAVDGAGNAYVTGSTSSNNFPLANALQGGLSGPGDAFVAKINAAGNGMIFSTYLGGSDDDVSYGLAVDGSGNAYLTGQTSSTNFPLVNPLQGAYGGGAMDAFITKINADGSALVYSTYLGGSGSDRGFSIAVDGSGSAYVAGQTDSTNFPVLMATQGSSGGGDDAFLTKINAAGNGMIFSTYLGGS
ncbi:MAG: SBBP repeat-containing protein, partial [Deltaproteobacteria bacterium]|nr:SBBP repeat-containing protein [Deltaproteobacteria bacterium]